MAASASCFDSDEPVVIAAVEFAFPIAMLQSSSSIKTQKLREIRIQRSEGYTYYARESQHATLGEDDTSELRILNKKLTA